MRDLLIVRKKDYTVLKDCGYAGGMSLEGRFEEDFKADYTRTRKILDLFNE